MSNTKIDYAAIGDAAAAGEDQTQMKAGGSFDRPVPAAGRCTLRLQQYIEFGKHPSTNPKYPKPKDDVMLRFEVNSPRHLIEIDTEEGKKKVPNHITIHLPKGGKTSKYGRLFDALNYSGRFNHFAQMVGTASWLAEISHNVTNAGTDKEKTYANLDKNGGWTFGAPVIEDLETGEKTPVKVAELDGDPVVFLWENQGLTDDQYLALWKSVFIDGKYEDGDKKGKSKNWIQDKIVSALDFKGSRLANLLEHGGATAELEDLPVGEDIPTQGKPEPVQETKAPDPVPAPEEDDIDPLVAAGLK